MSQRIPAPNEVVSALTAFPPKLSVLQSIMAYPEVVFEESFKASTGVALIPGPNRMLQSLMESFEASMPATMPSIMPTATARPQTASELSPAPSVEAPKPRRRFELT